MNLFQLFQKIVDTKRPLLKLINCGSSCYFDSLLALIVGIPTTSILDEILLSENEQRDQWVHYFKLALANCISHSVFGRGTTTCDKFKLRELMAYLNKDFAIGNCCDPTDVIQTLSEKFPKMKKDVFVLNNKSWKREKWPYCLSQWLTMKQFRATFNHSVLLVDTKDRGNSSFNFTEEFACGDYRLLGVIQRVNGTHYISIFVTRDLRWVRYDDSDPNLYRFVEPTYDALFVPLDQDGNGTTLLCYCHADAIEWPSV